MTRNHISRIAITFGLVLGIAGCSKPESTSTQVATAGGEVTLSAAGDSTGQAIGMNVITKECYWQQTAPLDRKGRGKGDLVCKFSFSVAGTYDSTGHTIGISLAPKMNRKVNP